MIETDMKICSSCFEECTPRIIDSGIGSYEYGSEKGTHTDEHVVSDCCEEPVLLMSEDDMKTVQIFAKHYGEIPKDIARELLIREMTVSQWWEEHKHDG